MRAFISQTSRVLFATTLCVLAACGSDSGTNPNNAAIDGTYTLQTVNGSPLPFTIQSGANSLTLTKDVLTVGSNGSWTESIDYTETFNGQTSSGTDADGGSWTRAGSSVTFYSNVTSGNAYTGTFSNDMLTLGAGGFVQVFTR